MTNEEYLKGILAEQTFGSDDQELKDLRQRRKDIEALLRDKFSGTTISIRWGGAMAKGTMIRESFDGDMTCYFNNSDNTAGESLEDIYKSVAAVLRAEYLLDEKTSALRVRDRSSTGYGKDFHIDVVPGRFTDDDKKDVYIHQNGGDKSRLKTNLDVHVEHIRDSGVIDAIRLMKLWNARYGVGVKTFVLELLTIKLLTSKKSQAVPDQLIHVWTEFRDNSEELSVEDPANPSGNDLKPALDSKRGFLSSMASSVLSMIENQGWEAVFGALKEEETDESKATAIRVAVSQVAVPTRPWCSW